MDKQYYQSNNEVLIPYLLKVFEQFRQSPTPIDEYSTVGIFKLIEKLTNQVKSNQPVKFVMLGFPFKSINIRDKVLGVTPDRAEEETIKNFKRFGDLFKEIYPPGVQIQIVSDGFIFNDILNVDDRIVCQYKEESMDMAKEAPMRWLDINDFYTGDSLANKREKVMDQFGITNDMLEESILFNPDVNFLYRGMMRFMNEELAIQTFPSNAQRQKEAKRITRIMMLRNEAYSNLVKENFKDSIRLSMHPSVNNGTKYSFQLIPSAKAKHSAWHAALVVKKDGTIATMHRKDAELAGYHLEYKDGRPFYYNA